MKKHPLLPLLMLLCLSQSAFAQGVDVRDWLGRPGVRLVAVEFYATWCKPCMEAMPRWKALQDTYADAGLRVIAVSTQDPSAGCASIGGFIPDENVCDLDGRIAQSFGVGNALPSAFLWSWQGNVLVERGHITEIEREVERYLEQNPRVLIQAGPGVAKGLSTAIERELVSSGKMTVVAKAKDRKAFMAIKKRQTSIAFDDSKACELGKEVPANSVLKAVMVGKGTTRYLNLALYDLETGCQLKAASARIFKNKAKTARAAVANLLATLKRKTLQMPRGNLAANVVKEKTLVKEVDDWVPKAKALAVVQFDSEPQGAMVTIGGKTICQATPCQKTVAPGAVKVIFSKANYLKKTVDSVAANQAKIKAQLDADFGYLTINTKPTGVPVLVDGTAQGPAPVGKLKLAHGPHRVELDARCHYPVVKEMNMERGKDRVLTLDARVRPAGVSVFVRDKKGNDLQGTVFVDGRRVGEAYETLKVPLCSRRLQLDTGDKKYSVKLVGQLLERQVTTLKLSVDGTRAKATWTKPNASQPVASTASEADWASGQSRLRVVKFNSTPPGAAVFVGDRHLCTTPCQRALVLGNHVVKMALERYLPKQERVDITKDGAFTWPLTPNFAPVMIKSKPRGVAIYVDGKKAGRTPYVKDLEAGVHTVAVKDPCYLAYSAQVVVKPGEPKAVDLPITPVPAGLEVRATDGKDDVVAEVFLDGTKLGVTPGTFKVPVCGKSLVVKHAKNGVYTKTLSLKAKQTTSIVATVSPQVAPTPAPKLKASDIGGITAAENYDGVHLYRTSEPLTLEHTDIGYGFVRVAKGSFKMGSPVAEPGRFIDETEHRVTLTRGFMMGRHEVTNEQYQRIMGGTDAFDCPNCPYDGASWLDAVAFANRLSQNEGLEPCYTDKGDVRGGENQVFSCTGYRLPTEAEWEYAARGGTTKARYGALNDVAWSGANAGFKARPVGKKAPNAFGLYDMLGNAWEWCHDRYGAYGSTALTDPSGPGFGVLRVKRGGSWFDLPAFVRAAKRLGMPKGSSLGVSGFRLVRSLR